MASLLLAVCGGVGPKSTPHRSDGLRCSSVHRRGSKHHRTGRVLLHRETCCVTQPEFVRCSIDAPPTRGVHWGRASASGPARRLQWMRKKCLWARDILTRGRSKSIGQVRNSEVFGIARHSLRAILGSRGLRWMRSLTEPVGTLESVLSLIPSAPGNLASPQCALGSKGRPGERKPDAEWHLGSPRTGMSVLIRGYPVQVVKRKRADSVSL